MAKIHCFSALLIRKKKKKTATTTTTEATENTKNGSLVHPAADEGAAADEHEDIAAASPTRRDHSGSDLQRIAAETHAHDEDVVTMGGHVSDPGVGRKSILSGSLRLKRSCSNMETRVRGSSSYEDLQALTGHEFNGSPLSVNSSYSADRVILKKKSTSNVLPSRSRALWWRLFLRSHRLSAARVDQFKSQRGRYPSDAVEAANGEEDQWVAFSMDYSSSPLDRVNAWVNSLEDDPYSSVDFDFDGEEGRMNERQSRRPAEELIRANHVIRSLNPLSTVAQMAGMGLRMVPTISAFAGLRAVNLSGNSIVHVGPGVLPKSLQSLDLSRNKIAAIEGLRDLTRLRALNLSYNKISRIGHGLANCTLIKELYLAGNKISNVEGLHRLLKLTVLDLSFNKLTTSKALGQLVAHYDSLLVVNLLGNPVQVNVGEDQLRKVVSGLLPRLTYLNRQPVNPQRARDGGGAAIPKAAFGGGIWAGQRMPARRAGVGPAQLSGRARRAGRAAGNRRKTGPSTSATRR